MVPPETIERAGNLLAEAAGEGSTVILFGSHARGEARPNSDLDFVVIEPDVDDTRAETVRLSAVLGRSLVPADVIVVTRKHVEEWRDVCGTAVHEALTRGRVLHGRP